MAEPALAPRIRRWVRGGEVVEHGDAAPREQAEDGVHVVLRVRSVDEQEVERRLRRQAFPPVAGQHADVLVGGEQSSRRSRARGVAFDGDERH